MIKVKEVSKNFEDFVALDNITVTSVTAVYTEWSALMVQESQHF